MNNSAWNARFHATTRALEEGDVGALERETEFAPSARESTTATRERVELSSRSV